MFLMAEKGFLPDASVVLVYPAYKGTPLTALLGFDGYVVAGLDIDQTPLVACHRVTSGCFADIWYRW